MTKEELKKILDHSDIFPSDCEDILNYVELLENNWNELKEWINSICFYDNDTITYEEIIDKMQEIESRK